MNKRTCGELAAKFGYDLPITVMKSNAGYYVGTRNGEGPVSRESAEYWPTQTEAAEAIETGNWTQRLNP